MCTAWPIPDGAGLPFASEFYASLLGLSGSGGALVAAERKTMAEAMRLARIKLAQVPNGNAVWGAYHRVGMILGTAESPARPVPAVGASRMR